MELEIIAGALRLDQLSEILDSKEELNLGPKTRERVIKCRNYLEDRINSGDAAIYGVNTGFGSLCDTRIPKDELTALQHNLVVSHACGMGDRVPVEISRTTLLLKIINLAMGNSGIGIETLDRLMYFYNEGILPVIYEMGSLGASGDLAPLAHLSLPLINRGEVWIDGEVRLSKEVMADRKMKAIELGAKEGLALLNGTQFMGAYGLVILHELESLLRWSDLIASASMDGFDCLLQPFDEDLHSLRSHPGQVETALNIRKILASSEIAQRQKAHVQDPYSFRCIPQVHGACRDAINYARSVFEREINSVTDNPVVFPDSDKIISGGNFHGQPLAMALDFLAISIAELGSISERRSYKLLSGQRGLPAYLIPNSGLNSGLMIPQYTAASLVSRNKQLCSPASVDSIDSSNGQEDHVSMGAHAALKCYEIMKNYRRILAVELTSASQALSFRKPLKSSPAVEKTIGQFRNVVPVIEEDTELHPMLVAAEHFISAKS